MVNTCLFEILALSLLCVSFAIDGKAKRSSLRKKEIVGGAGLQDRLTLLDSIKDLSAEDSAFWSQGLRLMSMSTATHADLEQSLTYSVNYALEAPRGATSGSLPGCRYIVRPTDKWTLPYYGYGYADSTSICEQVQYTATDYFGVDESLYILLEGSRVTCDDGTVYCVTSNYDIVKCGDLGCEKTTGGLNSCDIPTSEETCTYRQPEVVVPDALVKIEQVWDAVMIAAERLLKKIFFSFGVSILKEIASKKSVIMTAIRLSIVAIDVLDGPALKEAVILAIERAVPLAAESITVIGLGPISLALIIWDILNADVFVVKSH